MLNKNRTALLLASILIFALAGPSAALGYVAAPTNLTATASGSSIVLAWQDNANNESDYAVFRYDPAASSWFALIYLPADTTAYTNTGLTTGTTYRYYVQALQTLGIATDWSDPSNEASATPTGWTTTPLGTIPAAPTDFNATVFSSSTIELNWADNAYNEDGYRLERQLSGTGSWSVIATLAPNISTYKDNGLTPATSYEYRLTAYNAVGDSPCPFNVLATTLAATGNTPAAPTNLTATADSASSITLSWNDNSTDELWFRIDYRENPAAPWGTAMNVAADSTGYIHTGLAASALYQYIVTAVNASGDSQPSNIAEATTLAANGTPLAPIVMQFFVDSNQYTINGAYQTMDAAPVVSRNRLFLPIRYVVQPLGIVPQWDGVSKVTLQNSTTTIELWLDDNIANVNGVPVFIDPDDTDVMPFSIPPGRVMLPLRFVAENLGCNAVWDPNPPESAIITYPGTP